MAQCYNARQRLVQRNEPQHPPRRTPAGRPGQQNGKSLPLFIYGVNYGKYMLCLLKTRIIPMQPTAIPIRNDCNRHLNSMAQQD